MRTHSKANERLIECLHREDNRTTGKQGSRGVVRASIDVVAHRLDVSIGAMTAVIEEMEVEGA